MKKLVLCVVFLVAATGAFADSPVVENTAEPSVQAATVEATAVTSLEMQTPEWAVEHTAKINCPFGAPSCTPFNLEPCEEYCGPGFGACYRWCCVCTG